MPVEPATMHDEPKAIRARDRMDRINRINWQRKDLTLAMVPAPGFFA
jgi:hypothetical protein